MSYITLLTSQTAAITFEGYQYDKLANIVLSANNNTFLPYVCAFSFLTSNTKLSSTYSEISGYPLNSYTIKNNNYLTVNVINYANTNATYDIILINNAGYSKLSTRGVYISTFA